MSAQIRRMDGFVNCARLNDRTLFPLACALTLNAEKYFARNGDYAIRGIFICDKDNLD